MTEYGGARRYESVTESMTDFLNALVERYAKNPSALLNDLCDRKPADGGEDGGLGGDTETSRTNTLSLADAWELARKRTVEMQTKEKARDDRKRRHIPFNAGDLVLIDRNMLAKGPSHRFHRKRDGPFEVTKVFDNHTVELIGTRGSAKVNIDRCQPFKRRPAYLEYEPVSRAEIRVESRDERPSELSTVGLSADELLEQKEDLAIAGMLPFYRSDHITSEVPRSLETSTSGRTLKPPSDEVRNSCMTKNLFTRSEASSVAESGTMLDSHVDYSSETAPKETARPLTRKSADSASTASHVRAASAPENPSVRARKTGLVHPRYRRPD